MSSEILGTCPSCEHYAEDGGCACLPGACEDPFHNLASPRFETLDSGEREQFDSGMQRDTATGKTKWHLLASGPMLRRWAELLTRGAEKYDPDNWTRATGEAEYARFRESAFRHFMQYMYGEGGEDHAAAVFFNLNGMELVAERLRQDSPKAPTREELEDLFKETDHV